MGAPKLELGRKAGVPKLELGNEKKMPLDHYIPQVHLRKFYSPVLGSRMYAIRKSDLNFFIPRSQDVCRIMNGSTNAYLLEDRAIEDFLKTIEPKYNLALDKLIAREVDNECIYTIAGFIAYVISCSPAAMRLGVGPLKHIIEDTDAILEAQGLVPPPPPELGKTTLTELLRDGEIIVQIDPKYPQALGISSIRGLIALFGNSRWEILHNDFDDNPFFTSDFPVAIEETNDPRVLNKIVPLSPNLALRIMPEIKSDKDQFDFSFKNFRYLNRKVARRELLSLNRLIVRCAEDCIFYRDDHPWIRPFVMKNRHYHIGAQTYKLKTPTGVIRVDNQRVVAKTPSRAE